MASKAGKLHCEYINWNKPIVIFLCLQLCDPLFYYKQFALELLAKRGSIQTKLILRKIITAIFEI